MRQLRGQFGRSLAATAAGLALTGMVMAATGPAGISSANDDLGLPVPGVGPTEAQDAPEAEEAQDAPGSVEDRSPHSFGPSMPDDICSDPTKTCGFAETH